MAALADSVADAILEERHPGTLGLVVITGDETYEADAALLKSLMRDIVGVALMAKETQPENGHVDFVTPTLMCMSHPTTRLLDSNMQLFSPMEYVQTLREFREQFNVDTRPLLNEAGEVQEHTLDLITHIPNGSKYKITYELWCVYPKMYATLDDAQQADAVQGVQKDFILPLLFGGTKYPGGMKVFAKIVAMQE